MERILDLLDARSAEALAKFYSDLARFLAATASKKAAEDQSRARLKQRRAEAQDILTQIETERRTLLTAVKGTAGDVEALAIAAAAARFTNWQPDAIEQLWKALGNKPALNKARRDLEIVRLAGRPGWTNQRLAEKFKLSKHTISRIISRQLGGQQRRQKKGTLP